MEIMLILILGALLDLYFGDPRWIPHPVVLIGRLISFLEPPLRKLFPKTPRGERIAGAFLVFLVLFVTGGFAYGLFWLAAWISPVLAFLLQVFWSFQVLAARSLRDESMKVHTCLMKNDLEEARRAVSMIVGRDTSALTAEGITKAAVETVAENFSDGVGAPMLFLALGGAPLGLLYKAVNTMDSMVGYKNEDYQYFGTAAAKLDDAVNYIPARLCALLMIAVSGLAGLSGKQAARIWKRDKRCHKSPNSAQTEAACAGALGVQLAGDAYYFGKLVHKPTIGDALRPIEAEDIKRANRLMYLSSAACLITCCALRLMLLILF